MRPNGALPHAACIAATLLVAPRIAAAQPAAPFRLSPAPILTIGAEDRGTAYQLHKPEPLRTQSAWLAALDEGAASARKALSDTDDEFLETTWTLKAGGEAERVTSRADMIADTFAHLAHPRGQLTVYLRLLGATVPALCGPSADDLRYT